MRNNVVFVGEQNKINNELFQLLNWRFKVGYCDNTKEAVVPELEATEPELVVISMIGNKADYQEIFDELIQRYETIPVITISTRAESEDYSKVYENKQFHKILRPVTSRRILEICRAVIAGTEYEAEEGVQDNGHEKRHVLIVDDNAMVLRNIKSILEERYSVAVAPSGIHAFLAIGRKMPDLILLDYEMPEMNGKAVLEKLQADEELREIPVIFLTSVDSREIVMELLALKPAGYILKPVDSQKLLDRLAEIIGK